MTELFWKVADISFSASWIVLAVIAARFFLKKAPKWLVCGLWILVAIRLLCPFSIESSLSLVPDLQTLPASLEQEILVTPEPGEIVAIHSAPAPVQGDFQEHSGKSHVYMAVPALDDASRIVGPVSFPTLSVFGYLGQIWCIGMFLMAAYAGFTYYRIRRRVAISLEAGEHIFLCDALDTPFILGILRPRIYLPSDMPEETAAYVIAHERAHLHRKDHWWKPIGFVLLSIHWFNPLLWIAYILLCRDIELACDERVVKKMDASGKKAYSEALLHCSLPRHLVAACPLAFGEVGVKQRVNSVLNYKKPSFWILLIGIVIAVFLAICFLTDPGKNTLSDFYEGDRDAVTCVDLMNDKGHICLNAPSEINTVWELLDAVEYDPQPHTVEQEWDTLIDEFYAYHQLEFNIGEELQYLYFYRDYSSVCVEDEQGWLNHYAVENPAALQDFFSSRIDIFAWHPVTAEPFASVDQPYQWMQNVTLDAIQDMRYNHSESPHSIQGGTFTPLRAEEFLAILKDIPQDAISGPEILDRPSAPIFYSLTDDPNMSVVIQDGANDLGVVFRFYEEADVTHLEIILFEDMEIASSPYIHKVLTAYKWNIDSDLLLAYLKDLITYRPNVATFVGAEYQWLEERPKVSGAGASLSLRIIDGWQWETVPYTPGCESFGIRVRPPEERDGWIYFSFWPGGYFPEEVNRSYSEKYSWGLDGYTSFPITRDWYYGTGEDSFLWSYQRFPTDIGDYAIINENADSWMLTYEHAIRNYETFFNMVGGKQENFQLPEAVIIPVDYPQSENEQHGFKRFRFETADPAEVSVNSAWIYDETTQEYEGHTHLGAFWPEYITEGRVCIEYWEGGFQPDEDAEIEKTKVYYYDGYFDAYTGTLSGKEQYTWLWLPREHGAYVFHFENTQSWTDFQLECVVNHIIAEMDFS